MPRLLFPIRQGNMLHDELQTQRRSFDQIMQQAQTPGFTESFAAHAGAYPYAAPGLIYSMASQGIPAGDPVANALAEGSLEQLIANDPTFAIDDTTSEAQKKRVREYGSGPVAGAYEWFKAFTRGTVAGLSAIPQELSAGISSLADAATYDDGSFRFDDDPIGFFTDAMDNYQKKGARSELGLLAGEFWRRKGEGAGWLSDELWSPQAYEEAYGSGIFGGGEIIAHREEQKENLRVDGVFATPARVAMSPFVRMGLISPETKPYNALTGLGDAVFQVVSDPTSLIPVGKAVRGGQIANAASKLDDVSGALRLVPDGVDPKAVANRMKSFTLRTPQRVVDADGAIWAFGSGDKDTRWLVSALTRETSATRVNRLFNDNLTATQAQAMAQAKSPDKVVDVLRGALDPYGGELTVGSLPTIGRKQKRALGRAEDATLNGGTFNPNILRKTQDRFSLAADVPRDRVLNPYQPAEAASTFYNWARAVRMSDDKAAEFADEVMAVNGPTASSQLSDIVKRGVEALRDQFPDVPDKAFPALTRDVNVADEMRQYFVKRARDEMPLPGSKIKFVGEDGEVSYRTLQMHESVGPTVNGATTVVPSPAKLVDLSHQMTFLPEWKEMRRASSVVAKMGTFGDIVHTGVDKLAMGVQPIWIAANLLRPALTAKILLDSQARMALDGLPSIFSSPLEFIATAVANRKYSRFDRDIMGNDFKGLETFDEAMEGLSAQGFGLDGRNIPHYITSVYDQKLWGSDEGYEAAARALARWSQDPLTNQLAKGATVDEVAEWALTSGWAEEMNRFAWKIDAADWAKADVKRSVVRQYAHQHARDIEDAIGKGNPEIRGMIADGRFGDTVVRPTGKFNPTPAPAGGIDESDPDYVRGIAAMLKELHRSGDPMVARFTQKWPGAVRIEANLPDQGKFGRMTRWMFDTLATKPENAGARSPAFRTIYYRTVSNMVESGRMTQQDALELVSRMRKFGINDSPDSKLYRAFTRDGRKELDRLEMVARKLKRTGDDVDLEAIEAVSLLAGQTAADESLNLLYDLSNRKLWEDAASLAAPFVAVWSDTLKTYMHPTKGLITTSPARMRRAANAYQSARTTDFDGDGQTMIYTDENGQEVFVYPGWTIAAALGAVGAAAGGAAGLVAGKLGSAGIRGGARMIGREIGERTVDETVTGAVNMAGRTIGGTTGRALKAAALRPTQTAGMVAGAGVGAAAGINTYGNATDLGERGDVHFTGRPSGLNIAATGILPGVGPVVGVPLSYIVEGTPKMDDVWKVIFPFGSEDLESGVLESQLPAWMQRFRTLLQQDQRSTELFGNTQFRVAATLLASGGYETENGMLTQAGQNELLRDSQSKARDTFIVRALAQSSIPTGPMPEFTVDTPYGEMSLYALANEYRNVKEQHGQDKAFEWFVDRYGLELFPATIPTNRTVRGRSLDQSGADWERQNQDLVNDVFPNTVEFFAPSSDDDVFDFQAYNRAKDKGDLVDLTPADQTRILNNIVGSTFMRAQRNAMGDAARTPQGRLYLRDMRARLREAHPGYGAVGNLPSTIDPEAAISELKANIDNPDTRIQSAPATPAIREYLTVRAQAEAYAASLEGQTFQQSTDPRIVELRDALRREALRIMEATPEFAEVWVGVFERELRDDIGTLPAEPVPYSQYQGPTAALSVR